MLLAFVVVLLILAAVGSPYGGFHSLGWGPSGLLAALALMLLVLVLADRLYGSRWSRGATRRPYTVRGTKLPHGWRSAARSYLVSPYAKCARERAGSLRRTYATT
jgi:hypothetical protein